MLAANPHPLPPMSTSSTSSFPSLSGLIGCRKRLAALLHLANYREGSGRSSGGTNRPRIPEKGIREDVQGIITELQKFSPQSAEADPVLKLCLADIFGRIKEDIDNYINNNEDMAQSYRDLAKEVDDFKSQLKQPPASLSPLIHYRPRLAALLQRAESIISSVTDNNKTSDLPALVQNSASESDLVPDPDSGPDADLLDQDSAPTPAAESALALNLSQKTEAKSILEEVKCTIEVLQDYSNSAQDPILKMCMANVMGQIENILQEFITKFDKIDKAMAQSYKEVAKDVKEFKSQLRKPSASLSPLVDCRPHLAALLERAKLTFKGSPNTTENREQGLMSELGAESNIHDEVKCIIDGLLNSFQDPVLRKCMSKTVGRIKIILTDFANIGEGMAQSYTKLIKEVDDFKSQVQQSPPSLPSLSSLLYCGSCLVGLQQRLKSREEPNGINNGNPDMDESQEEEIVHDVVKCIIDGLLEGSNSAKDPVLKESMANVMGRMEPILEKFIKLDKAKEESYKELVKKAKDFKAKVEKESANVASSSLPSRTAASPSQPAASPSQEATSSFSPPDSSQAAATASSSSAAISKPVSTFRNLKRQDALVDVWKSKLNTLSDNEKLCLFCFTSLPQGKAIKKRDLIFWWIGMGLVKECSDGEGKTAADEVITKLVAEGFIYHKKINMKISNKYTMDADVHSKLVQQKERSDKFLEATPDGSFSIVHYGDGQSQPEKIEGLLNISELVFDANIIERLSKVKKARVVHLGSWGKHLDNMGQVYTVVEDVESLQKALNKLEQTRFLGLQGISGIVKLPDTVCGLKNLEVLDLKACNNLELLPEGIGSLQKLTHLDLSECYLLDHFPKNLANLSKLQMLKGFVVNPDIADDLEDENEGNRKPDTSSCTLDDLTKLEHLRNLTLRTRRMNFPTKEDLQSLCEMKKLHSLRIAWVGDFNDAQIDGDLERFPATVTKLELRTVPTYTASRLLALISKDKDSRLETLYIKGGGLRELDPEKHTNGHIKAVGLRYLSKLDMDWDEFLKLFPNLTTLKVFECPNLAFFPCDEDGWWER